MNSLELIYNVADHLKEINGIKAIVLGGSRARGTHTVNSDIDLGIYYNLDYEPNLVALNNLAQELDDLHRKDLVTKTGEWGPWINGGGWLTVSSYPVDFLYCNIEQVSKALEECLAGNITINYQPGHPHGFANYMYVSQIALCKILWDPESIIAKLKNKVISYPPILKQAIITKFLWEAEFSAKNAEKATSRLDSYYISGC